MSTKNVKEENETRKQITISPEIVMNAWVAEGGIELVAQRFRALRDLVDGAIADARQRAKEAEAEIIAKNQKMEGFFDGLGGVPPLDDAEQTRARQRGVRGVKPTPPNDPDVFRAILVQRILVAHRDAPAAGGLSLRALARWSGATGERVAELLKTAPEVTRTGDDRWAPATPAAKPTA